MNIIIENAQQQNFKRYRGIMPLNYQKLLDENPLSYVVLGARSKQEIIGIMIGKITPKQSIQIIYLFVNDDFLSLGIEEELLKYIEQYAEVHQLNFLTFEYIERNQLNLKYTEEFLESSDWPKFQAVNHIYTLKRYDIADECWYKKYLKNPKHTSFINWSSLSEHQRNELLEGESNWYPKELSPFLNEQRNDGTSSTVIQAKGKVIGWIIFQEIAQNMVLAKSLYVHEDYRFLLYGLNLLIKGIENVLNKEKWQYVMFSIEDHNKQMMLFVEKRLKRAILNKKTVYISRKQMV